MPDELDRPAKEKFRYDLEGLIRSYVVDHDLLAMPVVEDWVLVATVNDMADEDNSKWVYMRGLGQATHRTVGLLTMASDDLRGITREEII